MQLCRKVADQLSYGIEDTLKLGNRINVVGATGSGKTSTGKRLAGILGFPFVEMDALFWGPNWTQSPDDVLRARVEDAVRGGRWVIDGNYSRVQSIIWQRVDTVLWMGLPVPNGPMAALPENAPPRDIQRGAMGGAQAIPKGGAMHLLQKTLFSCGSQLATGEEEDGTPGPSASPEKLPYRLHSSHFTGKDPEMAGRFGTRITSNPHSGAGRT